MPKTRLRAQRRLLRALQVGAVMLVVVDLARLALRLSPAALRPDLSPAAPVFSALVSMVLLAMVFLLARRLEQAVVDGDAAARLGEQVLDAMPAGVVLLEADGRVACTNRFFDDAAAAGIVPEAEGREAEWVAQRLRSVGAAGAGELRRLPDGRWLRVVERRLPDRRVLVHLVDVTELVGKEEALEAARRDADAARLRLQGAVDAMPATFELYGPDDRLVLWNRALAETYPALARFFDQGLTFEQLARLNASHGGHAASTLSTDEWIAMRLDQRRAGIGPAVLVNNGRGRWLRMVETRLADGSMVAIRVDVTEAEAQRAELDAARAEAERLRRRLRDAIEALPVGFELYGADDRLEIINRAAVEMYPLIADLATQRPTFEEVVRTHAARGGLPELRTPQEVDAWIARRHAERRSSAPPRTQPIGGQRWVRLVERRLSDGSIVTVRLDITEIELQRRETEAARRDAELARQRLRDAIDVLPASFDLFDAGDRLVLFNRATQQLFPRVALELGQTWETLVRRNAATGGMPHLDAGDKLEAWIARRRQQRIAPGEPRLLELDDGVWVRVYERRTSEGGLVTIRLDVSELVRREGELSVLNGRLEQLNAELVELSRTDALTGLANRRAFEERLAQEMALAQRHGVPLALLVIDVDHFKRYNDHYGHASGDECLRRVAEALRDAAGRTSDLVARIGGEEFVLLLLHEDGRGALKVAQRCMLALEALGLPHAASPVAPHVTVSIGVADLEGSMAGDAAALFAAADAALYIAKAGGRSRAVLHGVTP